MIVPPSALIAPIMADGAVIVIRRFGNPNGPRLLLSHGNGYAIDGYFPFWRYLLDDFDVLLYDQRNHGHNPRHLLAAHTVQNMADDCVSVRTAIRTTFGDRPIVGVFHSVSAIANIVASHRFGRLWAAMFLIDPPLVPPVHDELHGTAVKFGRALSRWARGRQGRFSSPEELGQQLRTSPIAKGWVPDAIDLMAEAILRPTTAGDFELCCPPAFEAQIYDEDCTIPSLELVRQIEGPIALLCADPDWAGATPPAKVCRSAARTSGFHYAFVPQSGHMLHVEKPERAVMALRQFIGHHATIN